MEAVRSSRCRPQFREQREAAATLPAPGAVLGASDWVAEELLLWSASAPGAQPDRAREHADNATEPAIAGEDGVVRRCVSKMGSGSVENSDRRPRRGGSSARLRNAPSSGQQALGHGREFEVPYIGLKQARC